MGTYISFPFVSASLFICVPYALFVLLERTAGRRISSRALYRIGNAKALLFLLPLHHLVIKLYTPCQRGQLHLKGYLCCVCVFPIAIGDLHLKTLCLNTPVDILLFLHKLITGYSLSAALADHTVMPA